MKVGLLFISILLTSSFSNAQVADLSSRQVFKSVGLNLRLFDKIPYEVCFRMIDPSKKIGFQIKGAIGKYTVLAPEVYPVNVKQGSLNIDYFTRAGIVKPGITFINHVSKHSVLYLAASLNIAYTLNTLNLNFDDPIYGKVTHQYVKNVIYTGLELEWTDLVRFGEHFYVEITFAGGYAQPNLPVFDHIIPGLSSGVSYAPGQGYGRMYLNFITGLGYRF